MMAEQAEKAYRRGYEHGLHAGMGKYGDLIDPLAVRSWRFAEPLHKCIDPPRWKDETKHDRGDGASSAIERHFIAETPPDYLLDKISDV